MLWQRLAALALVAVAVAATGLLLFRNARQSAIQEVAAVAQTRFEGDRVEALIRLAGSPDVPLDRRNRAIWTLGELRDERALPLLESLHVQEECDHDRLVCQREVRKAIRKIHGELSPSAGVRGLLRKLRDSLGR